MVFGAAGNSIRTNAEARSSSPKPDAKGAGSVVGGVQSGKSKTVTVNGNRMV